MDLGFNGFPKTTSNIPNAADPSAFVQQSRTCARCLGPSVHLLSHVLTIATTYLFPLPCQSIPYHTVCSLGTFWRDDKTPGQSCYVNLPEDKEIKVKMTSLSRPYCNVFRPLARGRRLADTQYIKNLNL